MAGRYSPGAEGGRGGDAGRTFQRPGRSLGMLRKAEEGAGPLGSTETGGWWGAGGASHPARAGARGLGCRSADIMTAKGSGGLQPSVLKAFC